MFNADRNSTRALTSPDAGGPAKPFAWRRWLPRIGLLTFAFFFGKGLLWLALGGAVFYAAGQ